MVASTVASRAAIPVDLKAASTVVSMAAPLVASMAGSTAYDTVVRTAAWSALSSADSMAG